MKTPDTVKRLARQIRKDMHSINKIPKNIKTITLTKIQKKPATVINNITRKVFVVGHPVNVLIHILGCNISLPHSVPIS